MVKAAELRPDVNFEPDNNRCVGVNFDSDSLHSTKALY